MNFNTIITKERRRTNDTVEQANSDNRGNRPERVPPQEEGIFKDAEHRCQHVRKGN